MSEFSHIINNNGISLNISSLLNSIKNFSRAEFETISLVMDTEQFEMLLVSLKEAHEGKVVTMQEAFSDLN